jgi:hypothetical protein
MKVKDVINRVSKDQFIYTELANENQRSFALTECSAIDNLKHLCIDFGNNQDRYIEADTLIMILVEFYGKEYIEELLKTIQPYDKIKDFDL